MIHGGNNMEWNSVRELMTEFSETNRYRLIHGEGDAYFRHEAAAEAYCQKRYGCSVSELYEDEGSEVYWTEWYEKNQEG